MKNIILFAILLAIPLAGFSQKRKIKKANEDTQAWRYEVEACEEIEGNTIVMKIWSYSPRVDVAAAQACKNAVHATLFKGVDSKHAALVKDPDAQQKHADFFESFFSDNGEYMKFVKQTTKGALEAEDVLLIGKKKYKVGVYVSVDYQALRQYLEKKGIISKLAGGFI